MQKCTPAIASSVRKGVFAGKLLWLDGGLAWPRPTTQAILLEKFCGTNRSAKTTKLLHLKRFAIHSSQANVHKNGR